MHIQYMHVTVAIYEEIFNPFLHGRVYIVEPFGYMHACTHFPVFEAVPKIIKYNQVSLANQNHEYYNCYDF